MKANFYKRRII